MFNKYFSDVNQIKDLFKDNFTAFLDKNIALKLLLLDIFVDGTAYAIGGYFRDVLNGIESRDIDIIVDIKHELLIEKIILSQIKYDVNRHSGIKLTLDNGLEVDIWSIENNWAFRENLVKLNQEDKLNSIAKGCFFNYDALVINLNNYGFNIRYYKEFQKTKSLDILQRTPLYKNLNPTIEANILRAIYIKKQFNAIFTENTIDYLNNKVSSLHARYGTVTERLIEIKTRYPKYDKILLDDEIKTTINQILHGGQNNVQFLLGL